MGDITAPILVVTSWVTNLVNRHKQKRSFENAEKLLYFRPVETHDLSTIIGLENKSYPVDEKASSEALKLRQREAGGFFLVAILPEGGKDKLVGFTCGTLTTSNQLTHESMAKHEADGKMLCVHSVCVERAYRRKGIAKRMLQAYVAFIQQSNPQVSAMRLISKANLVPLYQKAGFSMVGKSGIQHGQDEWTEMELNLEAPNTT